MTDRTPAAIGEDNPYEGAIVARHEIVESLAVLSSTGDPELAAVLDNLDVMMRRIVHHIGETEHLLATGAEALEAVQSSPMLGGFLGMLAPGE